MAGVESAAWLSKNIQEEDNVHIMNSGERWRENLFF